ncbi:MAG: cytochrome c oxidase subunit II [Rhodospirillaceae bacterium]|nr:MAG: cytochrome c oxidase subunit II [Rhodospirillaceae bacterium]
MAIMPPTERLWWNEPVEKSEVLWVAVALIWALIMFFMMPYWHVVGRQNLSNEAYRVRAEDFSTRTEAMVAKHTVREEKTQTGSSVSVVHPPAGGDIYMLARLWEWYPVLELEKDKSYRLHLSSMDWQHGFSLQPENINLQVHPGYEMVVTVTPTSTGTFTVICNEFCGIGHHTMVGRIHVVDGK